MEGGSNNKGRDTKAAIKSLRGELGWFPLRSTHCVEMFTYRSDKIYLPDLAFVRHIFTEIKQKAKPVFFLY